MTIDDVNVIDRLIANNGRFADDPQVEMIVEYTNAWGNLAYGVTYITDHPSQKHKYLIATGYVQNPRIIWDRLNPTGYKR